MLLAIDVGNTNTAIGVYKERTLVGNWRISTSKERTSDEIGMLLLSMLEHDGISPGMITDVIMCTVAPPVMHSMSNAIRKYLDKKPILVEPGIRTGINIKYENPREVGSDKIVNAAAAINLYGGPVIIVDFGTATTFCAVNSRRDYLGGVICPGIKISAEALFEKAAKLPRIEIAKPKNVIGKTTVTSMQSGIIHGYVGQVDHIVSLMKQEMDEPGIKVVATGGMARLIASESKTIDEVNPFLSLEGLQIIYEMNRTE
ncbi:MAG TPA: type III pantothenate kinase [Thermoclostridium sp.]|nr:type III pantothenate kinase [Clostridiaceae bacterium]HOQ76056.1 type III pantothenate kinase [Thermoclostridium sp.]HPU45017.1 type III pantothenate kinase [Thermoclostridium sp.]